MKQKLKQKMKSYSFWTGLSASLVILINSIASIFGAKVDEEIIINIVMAICGVLVAVGVVASPASASQEKDRQEIVEDIDDKKA